MGSRQEEIGVDIRHDTGDFMSNNTGDLDRISGVDNLNQALYHRLITVKGSLVHKPDYGIGIQNWQGSLNNVDNQRHLALRIQEQFMRDNRVESVDKVRFEADDLNPDLFKIFVKYSAIGYTEIAGTFDPFELGV